MDAGIITLYFRALAILATVLLWGVSIWNGTVKALLIAVKTERLSDELPLQTKFTGIQLIDLPIAVLVAFFFYGTNGGDQGYQYFLLDAYSTLQSAFVWVYVEMARVGKKPKWVANPIVFGILWQCFGAAISLPLYYSMHLQWTVATRPRIPAVVTVSKALAIPFSFVFGAICPAIVGMLPTWFGPAYRTPRMHQSILAAWQPDPLWVSALYVLVDRLASFTGHGKNESVQKSYEWVKASYMLAAICSAIGHLNTVGKVLHAHTDTRLGFVRMYIPFLFSGPAETPHILMRGPWLFLQYDLIIISLSSLSWAFLLCSSAFQLRYLQKARLFALLAVGTLVIGPGATVSLALILREHTLHRQHMAQVGKKS